ncbi:MAG: DUF4340 domain-containing protein [Pseudomonadota bacterium]
MGKNAFLGIAIALGLAVAGVFSLRSDNATVSTSLLFPELEQQLNDVSSVRIIGANNQTKVTLQRQGETWVVEEKTNHPADVTELRKLLQGLASAKQVEQKTSKPELYDRLGVEGMDVESPSGLLLSVDMGDVSRDLIIGQTLASGGDASYVRKPDEAASWLVDQDLSVDDNPIEWLARDIIDLTSDRVQKVIVTSGESELVVSKANQAETNFSIQDVPDDRELRYEGVANALAGVLAGLQFDDVVRRPDNLGDSNLEATFSSFDGLSVTVSGFEEEDGKFITIAASVDAEQASRFFEAPAEPGSGDEESAPAQVGEPDLTAVNNEVVSITKTTAAWLYVIPDYKYDQIQKDMEDMLKPLEE